MTKAKRKNITASEKAQVMRSFFDDELKISDICIKYEIQPIQFYRWRKEFFINADQAFDTKKRGPVPKKANTKVANLEEEIRKKNDVIAELLEVHLKLKKKFGET